MEKLDSIIIFREIIYVVTKERKSDYAYMKFTTISEEM